METHRLGSIGVIGRKPIVILDTNILMMIAEGVSVAEDLEQQLLTKPVLVCTKSVVEELEKMASEGGKISRAASLALEFVKRNCKVIEGETGSADRDIVSLALSLREQGATVIVATNDRELRSILREAGVPTACYRESKGMIVIEEGTLLL